MKKVLTEEDFTTHPELKDAGFQVGQEVEQKEDGSFVAIDEKPTIKHILTEEDFVNNPNLANVVDGEGNKLKVGDEIEILDPAMDKDDLEQEGEKKIKETKEIPHSPLPSHEEILHHVNNVNGIDQQTETKEAESYPEHKMFDKFECKKEGKKLILLALLNTRPLTEKEAIEESKFLNVSQPYPIYLFAAGEKKVGDEVDLDEVKL